MKTLDIAFIRVSIVLSVNDIAKIKIESKLLSFDL